MLKVGIITHNSAMPGSIVENLRALREAAGLTRADVARLAKVSDRIVVTVEAGGTCEPSEAARIREVVTAVARFPTPVSSAPPVSATPVSDVSESDNAGSPDR